MKNNNRFRDPNKLEIKKEIKEVLRGKLSATDELHLRLLTIDVLEMASHYFDWVLGKDRTEEQEKRWKKLRKYESNDKW